MKNLLAKYENHFGRAAPLGPTPLDNFTTDERELEAVVEVFDSGYLSLFEGSAQPDPPFSFTGGKQNQLLEREWADAYRSSYAVAVNSATSGLYAAIGALAIGYGDEVIVSPYTMSACAIAPLVYGAIPIFADVDPNTGCIDPRSVAEKISVRTKAILVVHQFGFVADMTALLALADTHNLKIIEDCAQAHGARFAGQPVGTIGDIGVFSLNVNKTIQAGEGGVVVTNDAAIYDRLCIIRNHGENVTQARGLEDLTNLFGFNYRMTEVTAAISRVQLQKMPGLNNTRLALVRQLMQEIDKLSCFENMGSAQCETCTCDMHSKCEDTYYIFPFKLAAGLDSDSRESMRKVFERENLIFSYGYVKPLYLMPIFQKKQVFKQGFPYRFLEEQGIEYEYRMGDCPQAELLHFSRFMSSEHIRPPNGKDLVDAISEGLYRIDRLISG